MIVEGCVDSVASSLAAERGGARRLELCANLDVGGTTPSDDLVRAVMDVVTIPIIAMARPRGGDFVHSASEVRSIRDDIVRLRRLGVAGVVFGVLRPDGSVDADVTRDLVQAAELAEPVFHRAFDAAHDLSAALDLLIECGIRRVLTGGGPGPAIDNVDSLRRLVDQSGDRIEILAGGKVRATNVAGIIRASGVTQVHARLGDDERAYRELVVAASAG
jgi:copper homeostasis protein